MMMQIEILLTPGVVGERFATLTTAQSFFFILILREPKKLV